jgi:M6 family metalloprotease-like protein
MSWSKFSHVPLAGLFVACAFSASVAWANPVVAAKLEPSVSSENYKMEKLVFSGESFRSSPNGMSKIRSSNDAEVYSSGERYFPVMLVETADFKALDSAFIARMFNEEGFKENSVYGSVRDYYIESSGGKFKPTFDIYPVKLSQNFSNYNSESKFILPAIDVMVERADFKARASKYEKVIPFVILHPTSKEQASKINSGFFNHMYSLQYSAGKIYSKNGYSFNNYAFVSQKAENKPNATSTKDVAMLGAFIHEFSHVIGLVDLYSADANGYATIGPLPFDVMALGLRNGNGGYPPTFSAFEREAMGWLKPTEIVKSDSVYELKNLSQMQAYAVSNPNNKNEYFLIEYRPAVGFDSKIGSSSYSGKQGKNGVLIWYIDYDARAFASNDPNSNQSHQRAEVRTVLSKNQESFTGFEFVNNVDKSSIDGIFNLVFDGNDRVCFTVNRSKSLDKCPEKASPSSSAAVAPRSSAAVASSSSKTTDFAELPKTAHNVHLHVSHEKLAVEVPVAGKKTLRFYDALGNVVGTYMFEESFASFDISGRNGSVFVLLEVDGTLLFAKRVKLR